MPRTSRPEQGLLTREERYQLRILSEDLRRQAERASGLRRAELEQQLANIEMDRRADRQTRPRKRGNGDRNA